MTDASTLDRLTNETVDLLQQLIRNQCVNDGRPESGNEEVSAKLLLHQLEGTGVDIQTFEPTPNRTSLIARYEGTDKTAPSLCLMGHTDVVPVSPEGWDRDPFGGELVGDEIWGRGAVDMLNLTSSMAVAFRHIVTSGQRYPGDIIYFGVADEEAGGVHGAKVLIDTEWDALRCDYVLTEFGGIPLHSPTGTTLMVTTAEKGTAWTKITVKGTPGHGSMPYGTDNALVKAAEVVRRIAAYTPKPQLDELWAARILAMGFPDDLTKKLLDPAALNDALASLPPAFAGVSHACAHTTFSPNVVHGGVKTNVIPDKVVVEIDIRTLPGETYDDVLEHLRIALGDAIDWVDIESISDGPATSSPIDNSLWRALNDSMHVAYPDAAIIPSIVTGGTDSRFFREKGTVAFGAGLLSNKIDIGEFMRRFHGHNERIDVESLRLTTKLWLDVVDRLWL